MKNIKSEEINRLQLQFPSLSVNEGFARAALGAFLAQADPTPTELMDLKCALSEAVTNCTVHAYPETVGKIRMTVRLFADRTVTVEVRDSGLGIEDIRRAREPLFTTDAEGERSGMGFTVMESLTDKLAVTSAPGKGTCVRMRKKLKTRGKL